MDGWILAVGGGERSGPRSKCQLEFSLVVERMVHVHSPYCRNSRGLFAWGLYYYNCLDNKYLLIVVSLGRKGDELV